MTLGGSTMIYKGETFDYCYLETIKCLSDLCDEVMVVCVLSDDGTVEKIQAEALWLPNVKVIYVDEELWLAVNGREKLSYFSNIAIANLNTDYNFYLQCDEILHEDSFKYVREAMRFGVNGFMVTRYNLWRDSKSLLVAEGRMPCSSFVMRLGKTSCRCVGDAESLGIDNCVMDFVHNIEIFHMGFVRKFDKMKGKVINMVEHVFQMGHDVRLDNADWYRPMDYFKEEDLVTITRPLPIHIQKWAEERDEYNKRFIDL